jgi:acetyltransferase-like isoleucine patch superfamily enzyme
MITGNIKLGEAVDVSDGVSLNNVHTGNRGKIRHHTIAFGSKDHPLTIGDDFFVGVNCYLNGIADLTIGDRVTITHGVMIFTDSGPNTSPLLQEYFPITSEPITIGSDVWIGAGAMILPGVTIGNRCVIGAGSVVKENVPEGSVAAGVPAKVLKEIDA